MTPEEYCTGRLFFLNYKLLSGKKLEDDFEVTPITPKEPWTHEKFGEGSFKKEQMHLEHLIPAWVWKIFSREYSEIMDEEWSVFPRYSRRTFTCPYLGPKLNVDAEMIQIPYGETVEGIDPENVFGLNAADLKARKIENIDFLEKVDYEKLKVADPRTLAYGERAPNGLPEDWLTNPNVPKTTCYKLARADVKIFGVSTIAEKEIHSLGMRKPSLNGALNMWNLINEWGHLTMADVERMIAEAREKQKGAKEGAEGDATASTTTTTAEGESKADDAAVTEATEKLDKVKVEDDAPATAAGTQ